jgi:diguanylate cyclase (GGDEF)-like protein/PAS domain S-box-containing protein
MDKSILLIADDTVSAKAVQDALAGSQDPHFVVEWVRTCAQGLERLKAVGGERVHETRGFAAAFVDLQLPDSEGIVTFERLYAATPQIPILVLTTPADVATAKLAVQRGAQDYFFKDGLNAFLLPKALAGVVDRAVNTEALFEEKERAQVTLNSIGDAVISTDLEGLVTFLNIVAERLTGWPREEAVGRPLTEVFRIIDATTRASVMNPMALAIRENKTVGLTPNCVLVKRGGGEAAIEDSAAPIHDRRGVATGAVIVFHDVSAARALSQKMAYLAQHDSLTDLPNRVLLNDRLAQAMALAHRHKEKLAVMYLDIDRFKHINDSLGHAIGDRLLQSVSQRLKDCVRSSDTVSRQGGDEFVVLFSEVVDSADAATCAEKILQSVSEPHLIDDHDVHVTASIGIVLFPDDAGDGETLLKNADFAMYQAKDFGRNNYQFYKHDLNSSATERQSLETGLRHAIHRHEFELHYQPKMNLLTGDIAGVEALVRWRHPVRGIVPPAQFISIAEESGLIVPIGHWVLREACRQAMVWRDQGLPAINIAVNISAVELRAKDFVAGVAAILAESGFDPARLELELTETFLMQDSKSTATVLRALKDIGVNLALDDFGTGYSSLSYMKRFPIDTLKVDQSFVRDLGSDLDDANIVTAVINMGKSLHMRVVAEGVETREQLEFLEEHECPEAQGYYFSYPLVAGEFAEFLRHSLGD